MSRSTRSPSSFRNRFSASRSLIRASNCCCVERSSAARFPPVSAVDRRRRNSSSSRDTLARRDSISADISPASSRWTRTHASEPASAVTSMAPAKYQRQEKWRRTTTRGAVIPKRRRNRFSLRETAGTGINRPRRAIHPWTGRHSGAARLANVQASTLRKAGILNRREATKKPPEGGFSGARRKDQRLENCLRRRALWKPTFLRSTSRASRVTKPAFDRAGLSAASYSIRARVMPWRTAPA